MNAENLLLERAILDISESGTAHNICRKEAKSRHFRRLLWGQ